MRVVIVAFFESGTESNVHHCILPIVVVVVVVVVVVFVAVVVVLVIVATQF